MRMEGNQRETGYKENGRKSERRDIKKMEGIQREKGCKENGRE